MNSSSLSFGFSLGLTKLTPHNHFSQKMKPNDFVVSNFRNAHQQISIGLEEKCVGLGRREVLGIGFFNLGLLDALMHKKMATAVEDGCTLTVVSSGLAFCDRVIGTGPEAAEGQLIKAHYTGKLENGKVFDSSYDRRKPLTFRVGVGEVIKGWDQGILGAKGIPPMHAGGKRTLKIPAELAYGSRGAGCRGGSCIIPPDSVLVFDVEFIGKA